jgi:hypothetical protein
MWSIMIILVCLVIMWTLGTVDEKSRSG